MYNIFKAISVQNTQYTIMYSVTVGNSDPCLWSHLLEHSLGVWREISAFWLVGLKHDLD